jgi:hypothetical protein
MLIFAPGIFGSAFQIASMGGSFGIFARAVPFKAYACVLCRKRSTCPVRHSISPSETVTGHFSFNSA